MSARLPIAALAAAPPTDQPTPKSGSPVDPAVLRELEARGRAQSLEGVQEILEQINAELESVHEHLSAERPGARNG